jgi:hypothetical protein
MRLPVRDKMPVDIRRVVLAAVQAALEDERAKEKKGLSGGRAVAVGAALALAARMAAGPGTRLVRDKLEDGSLRDMIEERFSALTHDERDEDELFDEPEDYDEEYDEPEDEEYDEEYEEPADEEYDEPEAEEDEELVDEEYDEPEAEEDEEPVDDEYDEPEAEEDEEYEASRPSKRRRPAGNNRPSGPRTRPRPAARPPRHSSDGDGDGDEVAAPPPRRPSRRRAPVGRS